MQGRGGAAYDPLSIAAFAAMSPEPDAARKRAYDDFFKAIRALNVHERLSFIHLLTAHDEQAARLNLLNPGTNDLTGSPTFSADVGFTGNGTSTFLTPNGFAPDGSGLYKQDDCCVGTWVLANPAGVSSANYVIGSPTAAEVVRLAPSVSAIGTMRARLSQTTNLDGGFQVGGVGFSAINRNNSANFDIYRDGVKGPAAITATSAGLPTSGIYFLRTGSSYSASTLGMTFGGGSLTDDQMRGLYIATARYLLNVGAITKADLAFVPGAWTWFSDQRIVEADGQALIGAVGQDGKVVAAFNSLERSVLMQQITDDHPTPAFIQKLDGKWLALTASRNLTSYYLNVSTDETATFFGAATDISSQLGTTVHGYSNLVRLTGEPDQPLYNFYRGKTGANDYTMHYSKSTDDGDTWSTGTRLLTGKRPYFRAIANGANRIDFCCTDGHPNEAVNNNVYHFYYEAGGFFDTEGNALSVPITPATDLTPIWDGSGVGGEGWVWDIRIDPSGHPVIAYAVFPTPATDHRYRYARWNGSSWDDNEVCAAGPRISVAEDFYSGGICIDPDDVNVVYVSRKVSPDLTWVVYREVTANRGSSWSETSLTADAVFSYYRPRIVEGRTEEPRLAVLHGVYTDYDNCKTRVELIDSH